ncbi:choice-of-anchor H family protein [Thalassotalea fusca]
MNKLTQTLTIALLTLPLSLTALANSFGKTEIQTFSAQGIKLDSQSDLLLESIKEKQASGTPDQNTQGTSLYTRDEHIALKQKRLPLKQFASKQQHSKSKAKHHAFTIYSAYTQLIEDFDYDGFYQTFSVTFDADVLSPIANEYARVYAELYISENGGPWMHYFTTDSFNIYGESTDDEYEVYSTLNQGFPSGEYDILIDLYEEGYSDIVATYSAEDDPALYAVPLESSDYDVEYTEIVVESHGHGGSFSGFALLPLALIAIARRRKMR